MRIESLLIERYGIHADRRFDFAPGLQVLYGPNEAGKTTLLQLIRDLFFGYEHQHPYRFDSHDGPLKATAECMTHTGTSFWFSRQKGRPDQIAGEISGSRETVDADVLHRLIGRITQTTYQQLFAFSLEELRKGGAVLKEEGLNEALFGAGMGGLPHLRAVQQRLQCEAQNLFNPRARKPLINELLPRIQAAKEKHRQSSIRPQEYVRRVEELRQHTEEAAEIKTRLDELGHERSRLTRYQRALPIHREGGALRARLMELPDPHAFPGGAVERFHKLRERQAELESELKSLLDLPAESQAVATQVEDERILKAAADIRLLRGRYAELAARADEQSSLENRVEAVRRDLADQLSALPSNWTRERLASFKPAPQDVEMLQRLEKEISASRQNLGRLEERQGELTARIETLAREIEDHPDDQRLPALESLLEHRDGHWQLRSRLKEVQQRIAELSGELEEEWHMLASGATWATRAPDDVESLLAVRTPLLESLNEFEEKWRNAEERQADLQSEMERLQSELSRAKQKLAELDGKRHIPDPEQLTKLRQLRDQNWDAVKQQLESSNSKPATADRLQAAEAFERSLRETDTLADELLRFADEVAHFERLRWEVSQLEHANEQVFGDGEAHQQSRAELTQRWQELWQVAGVRPHSPAVMRKWLEMLQAFRDRDGEMVDRKRQESEIETELAGPQRELTRAFPDAIDIGDAWRRAQQLREQLRDQHLRRADLLQEHREVGGKLSVVEKERFDASLRLAQIEQRRLAIAQRYEFPLEWDHDTSLQTLVSLFDTARKLRDEEQLESLLSRQQQSRDRLRGDLSAVIERTAPDLAAFPESAALDELESRLQAAEQRVKHSRDLAERQSNAERVRVECLRKQGDTEDQLARLAGECGVTPNELERFIDGLIEANEVRGELKLLQSRLAAVLQPGETEQDLEACDVDAIEGRLLTIGDDIRVAQEQYSSAQQRVGVLRDQLEKLEDDDAPTKAAAELAGLHAKLAGAVDQWAPLALADYLMTSARERFEQLHQPRLIGDVQRLFHRMTAGQYQEIACSLDQAESDPLKVRHRDGTLRTTNQLSAGTAEQLYLAIRLAYVADYARLSEPMPVVMDDVLVNFDEQRALATLNLLIELAASTQILLLTCHRRTIELLHQLQSDANIVAINGSFDDYGSESLPAPGDEQDRELRKPGRRTKRRVDKSDQPALFPPS